jgi:WD40 repeat protein
MICSMAVLVVLAFALPTVGAEEEQEKDRRDREFPELVVDAGGRQGTCDSLLWTRDGKYLLAAGDDKVVHVWQYRDGKLDPDPRVLRWPAWRERRGSIYTLALSPDQRHVAVGGWGILTSAPAILDRATGEVVHAVLLEDKDVSFGAVRAIAYSPSGERVALGTAEGSVWVWSPKTKETTLLGWHQRNNDRKPNRVRLVRFLDDKEQTLLSIAESGEVLRWRLGGQSARRERLHLGTDAPAVAPIFNAVASNDGKWLAVSSTKYTTVRVCSLSGDGPPRDIPLPKPARSIAFSGDGRRLAIAFLSRVPGAEYPLSMEGNDTIEVWDLTQDPPARSPGPPHRGRAEALAFHPREPYLAVAGGDNQEVTLWNENDLDKPASVARGAGRGLWGIALSEDGKFLGFQDQRDSTATHPNRRGEGPWQVFDLQRRDGILTDGDRQRDFKPHPPEQTRDGWRVEPDRDDPYLWYAVSPRGKRVPLDELDGASDQMPRCYAFLPPAPGQQNLRLAVGHNYGVSVFELTEDRARRLWRGAGHQGSVVSVAPSADGKWLVTASTDQTIAAWSLHDRDHSELGAEFAKGKGGLRVTGIEFYSPAHLMGLTEGQQVVGVIFDGSEVLYTGVPTKRFGPPTGSQQAALDRLANPVPGKELAFLVRFADGTLGRMITTVLRRPVWRFFPARNGQWVIWLWGHHYYQTSEQGDAYVGWLVNNRERLKTPTFYHARDFEDTYHRDRVFDKLLDGPADERRLAEVLKGELKEDQRGLGPPPDFRKGEPDAIEIKPGVDTVEAADLEVKLTVRPRSKSPDYAPERAELWVNDHCYKDWDFQGKLHPQWKRRDKVLEVTVRVPNDRLRAGKNVLTFQCYNRFASLGRVKAEKSAAVQCKRAREVRRLFVMAVGISDYSQSAKVGCEQFLHDLKTPVRDAEELAKALRGQTRLYDDVVVALPRAGVPVNRDTILAELDRVAQQVRGDDHFLLFLAGHGLQGPPRGAARFLFCCGNYDPEKPGKTAISDVDLRDKFRAIACRKTVFLDACYAGQTITPVRALTPGGQGPSILAACDTGQRCWESPKKAHGLFTLALLEALGDQFDAANVANRNGLDLQELFDYVRRRLPGLLRESNVKVPQTPVAFPRALDRTPLFAKRTSSPGKE